MAPTTGNYALREEDTPKLLFPYYLDRAAARPLERAGLLWWDAAQEYWQLTAAGERAAQRIRSEHAMTWDPEIPGGGRWVVEGRELHCGDLLEIMLADGTWRSVRFEVKWDGKPDVCGGRVPVLHIGLAGGSDLVCGFDVAHGVFRWPRR